MVNSVLINMIVIAYLMPMLYTVFEYVPFNLTKIVLRTPNAARTVQIFVIRITILVWFVCITTRNVRSVTRL